MYRTILTNLVYPLSLFLIFLLLSSSAHTTIYLLNVQLLETIDRGTYAGGAHGRMWALDPIDGTKGFLRGEQFAVCLALIVDGQVQVGVMGCPNLPVDAKDKDGEKGCLFITVKGQGAFQVRSIFVSSSLTCSSSHGSLFLFYFKCCHIICATQE